MAISGTLGIFPAGQTVLTNAGGTTDGSANEGALALEVVITTTNSQAAYEKYNMILWSTQTDPSDYPNVNVSLDQRQVTRDGVTLITTGVLAVDYGRAWGQNTYATKLPDRVGYTVGHEYSLVNNGVDCKDPHDSIRGALGIVFGPSGTTPQTAFMRFLGAPGSHYGMHFDAGSIVQGGAIINTDQDETLVRTPQGDIKTNDLRNLLAWAKRTGKI